MNVSNRDVSDSDLVARGVENIEVQDIQQMWSAHAGYPARHATPTADDASCG